MPAHYSDPTMPRAMPLDHGPADAILATVEAHWQDMRRGSKAPYRTDIDPRTLDAALPWSFVLQRTAPGATRLRVAGQKLHDLIKMDPRGMPLSTLINPASHGLLSDWVETAFQAPALIELDLTSPGGLTQGTLRGRLLLLPLRNALGETYRLFGAIVTDGNIGMRQRRFDIDAALPARIVHLDDEESMASPIRAMPTMTDTQEITDRKPFHIATSENPNLTHRQLDARGANVAHRGSHLRLVVNNS